MTTSNETRQQLIQRVIATYPDEPGVIAFQMWQLLASQLNSTIGRGGFNALFCRSLHVTASEFPWLSAHVLPSSDEPFTELISNLGKQSAAEAYRANAALLLTFTDILASLIGDSLTTDIINSAWREKTKSKHITGNGISK